MFFCLKTQQLKNIQNCTYCISVKFQSHPKGKIKGVSKQDVEENT